MAGTGSVWQRTSVHPSIRNRYFQTVIEDHPDFNKAFEKNKQQHLAMGEETKMNEQVASVKQLEQLHHAAALLVLPNIWDVIGARLLEKLGYPALATASAAIAFSQGFDD